MYWNIRIDINRTEKKPYFGTTKTQNNVKISLHMAADVHVT